MPAGWLVPALQMGAALIGAKASGDAAKASQRGTDLKKLRKEAEAAGFNPLTVLRATGGQGFNKGSSGALASASFWSSFANSAGQIAGQFDLHKREMQRLDRDIAGATFDGMMIDQGIAIDRDLRDAQRLELDKQRLKLDMMQAGEGTYGNPIESSVWYILPDGTKTLGPNPDAGEIENMLLTPTLATGATFTADAPNTSRMKRDGLTSPALERQPYVQ
jgi:hypothetical protein